jgi:DNA (cytosine-5)-methyltransferase 1
VKAISLFSGAGGFEIGFERAGIETVLQAERDPWALEVLARHWPQTERVDDVRAVGGNRVRTGIGIVYGGFPCQDLSVAGKRAGLGGDRSGLWFEFHRVLSELRPRWAVIENVPGLLSSNQGRDFAVVLDGLDDLGFAVGWAVLDAQHFGVPQRRRRVFIVAGPSRRAVEQVLSLCEGCGGNPETGGTAGEGAAVAPALRASGVGSERVGDTRGQDPLVVSVALRGRAGGATAELGGMQANALRASQGGGDKGYVFAPIPIQDAREVEKQQNGLGIGDAGDPMFTIDAASRHGVLAPTLYTHLGDKRWLENQNVGNYGVMQRAGAGVRRLTPLECERLMGWPDDHTRWTADGREIADSHRYRMCGNGVVAPVAEWLAHRLVEVDKIYGATNR